MGNHRVGAPLAQSGHLPRHSRALAAVAPLVARGDSMSRHLERRKSWGPNRDVC
jgi:hypothetical protein